MTVPNIEEFEERAAIAEFDGAFLVGRRKIWLPELRASRTLRPTGDGWRITC